MYSAYTFVSLLLGCPYSEDFCCSLLCLLLAVVPWLAAMMQTLTTHLDGPSHMLLSLLQMLTQMTTYDMMHMSQHLLPWGDVTC